MGKIGRVVATQGRLVASVVLSVLLLLQSTGCTFFREQFRAEAVKQRTSGTLSPYSSLSQSETAALLQQALTDPSFQEVRAKPVARGYSPLDTPALALNHDQGALLLVPFAQASSAGDQGGEEQPGLPMKPSSRPPTPKPPAPPTLSAYPAYVAYVAYSNGEKTVFGAIDEGTRATLVHPHNDRSLVVVEGDVLLQLRGNERFRKFEASIAQMGGALGATTLVDEGRRTAYLILSVFTRVGPYSYSSLLHDPQYAVSAVYLATCGVRSWGPTGVTLDPDKVEVFQGSKLDQDAYTPEGLAVERYGGTPIYTVIAGGARPVGAGDLQGFSFYTALPDHSNQITGGGTAPTQAGPNGPRALTVFAWGLLDAPPDNVLLQFKTDAELTLAAYNSAMSHARYGVRVSEEQGKPPIFLGGLQQPTVADVQQHISAVTRFVQPSQCLTISVEGMMSTIETIAGIPRERIAELLLLLAEADRQSRFEQVYEELLPQGLAGLEKVLSVDRIFDPPTQAWLRTAVRELAKRFSTELERQAALHPQALPLPPMVVTLGREVLALLGKLIFEFAVATLVEMLPPHPPGYGTLRIEEMDGEDWFVLELSDGSMHYARVAYTWSFFDFDRVFTFYYQNTGIPTAGYAAVLSWIGLEHVPRVNIDPELCAYITTLYSLRAALGKIGTSLWTPALKTGIERVFDLIALLEQAKKNDWKFLGSIVDQATCSAERVLFQRPLARGDRMDSAIIFLHQHGDVRERAEEIVEFVNKAATVHVRSPARSVPPARELIGVVFPRGSDPDAVVEVVRSIHQNVRPAPHQVVFVTWWERKKDGRNVVKYYYKQGGCSQDWEIRQWIKSLTPHPEGTEFERYETESCCPQQVVPPLCVRGGVREMDHIHMFWGGG